jgi:dipeptidyl aminopeptidase/acylaminoacyl peptidase
MNSRSLELLRRCSAIIGFTFAWLAAHELNGQDQTFSFRQFREKHRTRLTYEPDKPPASVFNLIKYKSPIGDMSAYVSPDPGDGKKHPLIIWLVGGFSNSIGGHLWKDADASNDQTAAAYRKAGVLMMFPSLRGGNDNPGKVEVCFGEVNDVIAAAEHAKKLPYVDPARIYLGGHSTGGTLALVVAGSTDLFRAVISYGPVHSVAGYGQDNLPFDGRDTAELIARAPLACLGEIKSRTFILEGTEDGNLDSVRKLSKASKNAQLHFHEVPGATHFNILAPFNKLMAGKLLADTGNTCEISLTADETKDTAKLLKSE